MRKISIVEYVLISIILIIADLVGLAAWLLEGLNIAPGLGVSLHGAVEGFDMLVTNIGLGLYMTFKGIGDVSSILSEKIKEETKEQLKTLVKKAITPTVIGMVTEGASAGLIPSRWIGFTITYIRHNGAVDKFEEESKQSQEQANTVYDQIQPQPQLNAPLEQVT